MLGLFLFGSVAIQFRGEPVLSGLEVVNDFVFRGDFREEPIRDPKELLPGLGDEVRAGRDP